MAPKDEATLNELRNQEAPKAAEGDSRRRPSQPHRCNIVCVGPGGCSYEMLRVLLDDHEGLLLTAAADDFARGDVPEGIFSGFMLSTLTALQKREGGVRGVATAILFRRLVAKTLASQFVPVRFLHTSGQGLCGARTQFDDVQVIGRAGSREVAALRMEGIFPTVTVRMGRP